MKSLLKKIKDRAVAAMRWIFRLKDPAVRARVLDAVDSVHDLLEFALPAVERVAKFTEGDADDRVVEALKRINRTADGVLSLEDKAERDGALLALGCELTKMGLEYAINAAGSIRLGNSHIAIPTDVANSLIRAAVDYAYGVVFKHAK